MLKLLTLLLLLLLCSPAWADNTRTVAVVIAAEAAGEGEVGMRAVACVIANRARAQGKTPYQIVTARNQFYGLTARNRERLYQQVRPIADRLAREIMELPDITGGALHFRTARERLFPWCKIFTVRIGKHLFYR